MTRETSFHSKPAAYVAGFFCVLPILATLLVAASHTDLRLSFLGSMPLVLRYLMLVAVPALALWGLVRVSGRKLAVATLLLLGNASAFVVFVGLAQSAALLLLVAVAAVLGCCLLPASERPETAQIDVVLLGVLLIVGGLGWMLPIPMHSASLYLAVSCAALVLGWRRLCVAAGGAGRQWSAAVAAHPAAAAFAVLVAGFAAIPAWLPSMTPDDNAAHLLLSQQLRIDGYSRLDVSSQLFAVAPWFNNTLHALLTLLQGSDARSAVGAWWLVVGCLGAYRLAKALGAQQSYPWLAAALYASHPLTAYFGMTLQVDGASAALLMHLLAACVGLDWRGTTANASPWVLGALCGALMALKITNAIYVGVIGVWLTWRFVAKQDYARLACMIAVAAVVAASSYVYATVITGNPVFPLFNGIFKSPYFPAINFNDVRCHAGVSLASAWDLTFATSRYMEAFAGAAGLCLLALIGAWLLALRGGWLAAVTVFAFASGLLVFSQVQYLRYIFPALAVLGTVAVVVFSRLSNPRIWGGALLLLIVAQCGLVRSTTWLLLWGAEQQLLAGGPEAVPDVERAFVPERALLRRLNAQQSRYCLLFAEKTTSYIALAPAKSLAVGFYDPKMRALAKSAQSDVTGGKWISMIQNIGFTHVEFRPGQAPPGLIPALRTLGFQLLDSEGEAQLWAKLGADPSACLDGTIAPRNEVRRLLSLKQ